jgi:hypothetical protein
MNDIESDTDYDGYDQSRNRGKIFYKTSYLMNFQLDTTVYNNFIESRENNLPIDYNRENVLSYIIDGILRVFEFDLTDKLYNDSIPIIIDALNEFTF